MGLNVLLIYIQFITYSRCRTDLADMELKPLSLLTRPYFSFWGFPFPVVCCRASMASAPTQCTGKAKGRVISKRFTDNNRAGQLTNQSRLGSGFRQRGK